MEEGRQVGRDCRPSLLINTCLRLRLLVPKGPCWGRQGKTGELNDQGGVLQGQGQSLGKLSLETWDTQKGKFLSFPASPSGGVKGPKGPAKIRE